MDPTFDPLRVATRVFTVRTEIEDRTTGPNQRQRRQRRQPQRTLVLDTETTVDATQRLVFGVWRYYTDRWNYPPGQCCVEEGIVYADDLPDRDPDGFALLLAYALDHRAATFPGRDPKLHLLSRSEFVEKVLYRYGFKLRATAVGFNLPFDLSRLAVAASTGRGRFSGGNSLKLWERERFRPRVAYKSIDSRRNLFGYTTPADADEPFRGHFLDLRTLTFALTDRGHSLESACAAFGVPYVKQPVEHGAITEDYVTYCREDVEATARLFGAATSEYHRHPIELQETKAFSPASIGKAYLRAMGIRPILDRQPDFDPSVLGWAMSAFFGGRAECRIRKTPLPVVYVDFLSMYPTVNALMGTWKLVTAQRVAIDDVTDKVRRLLSDPDLLDRCFRREFWPELIGLVEVVPEGDVLPVRAAYDAASPDFGIGVNPYRKSGTAWYSTPDFVASALLTKKVPAFRRAIRFRGVGRQGGLVPLAIRGMVEVDPAEDDFFRQVIELRHTVKDDLGQGAGEAARLSGFLKVLANSSGYGIAAEFVRHEEPLPVTVDVFADTETPFEARTAAPEDHGPYCFPPLAATITGAARLMLAMLERLVTDAGGSYVFCDTDSMAIVADRGGGLQPCAGGQGRRSDGAQAVRALSWRQVDDIVERFGALSPYDRWAVPGSILKIEKENLDTQGRRRQLWCWAISSKRYVLYTLKAGEPVIERLVDQHEEASREEPELAKVSEHGLGHLLNPLDPDDSSVHWIELAWTYLLRKALGLAASEPEWLNRPALTRVTVSGPAVLHWFSGMNKGHPYAGQVKPANFLLLAHPDPLDPSGVLPVAPYEPHASKWTALAWVDRRTGEPVRVTTEPLDGTVRPGTVRVRTYGDVLNEYVRHPESKSLGPDGKPVGSRTAGLLQRRPVEALPPSVYIGKEGNKLDDRLSGLVTRPEDYRAEYVDPSHSVWSELVLPVVATINRGEVARRSCLSRRTIERYLYGGMRPNRTHETKLTEIAFQVAKERLVEWGEVPPADPCTLLYRYLDSCAGRQPLCGRCGRVLAERQWMWCSEVCRSRAR